MGKAKVWNDNVYPHSELFKGQQITIPPKAFVEMDYEEAIEFKCQFTPIKTDGERNPLPESFKMIRVEALQAPKVDMPLMCHATGKLASSPEELARMNAEHYGQLEEKSKEFLEQQAQIRAENEDLKARLAALEAKFADKRGPGRPRKDET